MLVFSLTTKKTKGLALNARHSGSTHGWSVLASRYYRLPVTKWQCQRLFFTLPLNVDFEQTKEKLTEKLLRVFIIIIIIILFLSIRSVMLFRLAFSVKGTSLLSLSLSLSSFFFKQIEEVEIKTYAPLILY